MEGAALGAWGDGPFDNDTAADWCGYLDEAAPPQRVDLIRRALAAAAGENDYLDSEIACCAIAAAAVVAAQRPGAPPLESPYAPRFIADGVVLQLPDDVRELAVSALDRVTGVESEWRALWEEADSYAEAANALEFLRAALAG